jgi:hypothetical protein
VNALSPLARAPALLETRLAELEARIRGGEETAWPAYLETVRALSEVLARTAPGADGQWLTTAQLAARLQISTRTIRRRMKAGALEPVRLAKRGRAALRWGTETAR